MRRFFLFAVAALLIGFAQAQFKPTGGTFGLEVQFRPFGNNLIRNEHISPSLTTNDVHLYGLSGRYFCTEKLELRADLFFGFDSDKNKTEDTANHKETEIQTFSSTMFGINLGVNYHFKGTERISPYVGAVVGVGFMNLTNKTTNWGHVADDFYKSKEGGVLVDFAAVTGFNWYVVDGLYLGAELGLGLEYVKGSQRKITTKRGGSEVTVPSPATLSNFGFGFFANPAIRLGWKF
jgi:outer membrane protein W